MQLTYHSQTLRLLGVEPRLSPRAVEVIERSEAACGVRLPAAVRELYALEGVPARLERPNWCAAAVPLGVLLRGFRATAGASRSRAFRFYQDGGDAVRVLPGSDDPPTDSSGPYPGMGLNLADGQHLSFSEYVRRAAWAARTNGVCTAYVGIDNWPGGKGLAGPPHLDFLAERYEEWMRTPQLDWPWPHEGPHAHHHCFFGPSVRIHLRTAGDPAAGVVPACWWLYGDTEAALFDLYAELWPAHGVPLDIEAPASESDRGPRIRFRKRFPNARLRRR